MDVIAIAIVGTGIVLACAGAFLVLTAPDDDAPDEGELGGEAFIPSSSLRVGLDHSDPVTGLAAGNGGESYFIRNEGDAGKAAPAVLGPRSRFRVVS